MATVDASKIKLLFDYGDVSKLYKSLTGRSGAALTQENIRELMVSPNSEFSKSAYGKFVQGVMTLNTAAMGDPNGKNAKEIFARYGRPGEKSASELASIFKEDVQAGNNIAGTGVYFKDTADAISKYTADQGELNKFLDVNKPDGVSDEEWAKRSEGLKKSFWKEYDANPDYNAYDVWTKLSKDFSQAFETPEETTARLEMEDANKDLTGTTTDAGTPLVDYNGDGKITNLDKTLGSAADREKEERSKLATGLEEGRQKALGEVMGGIEQARGKIGEYQKEYTSALEQYNASQEPELLRRLKEAGVAGAGLNAGGVQAGIAESLMNQRAQAGLMGAQYGLDLQSQLDQAQLNAQSQYAGLGAQNAAMVGQYGYDEGMSLQNVLVTNYLNQFGYQAQMAAMNQTQRHSLLNQNIQNSYQTTARATDFQNSMTAMQQAYEYNKALQNQNRKPYSGLGSAIGSLMGGGGALMSGFGALNLFANKSKQKNPSATSGTYQSYPSYDYTV